MEDQMSGQSKELEFSPGEGGGGPPLMHFYLDVVGRLARLFDSKSPDQRQVARK
jgi:hypothetical protein